MGAPDDRAGDDNHRLEEALNRLADLMSACRDPWCVFGGTAMRLHGYRMPTPIADIDVLISVADAERLVRRHGYPNVAGTGTERFRSQILLRPDLGKIPVEIMAGFDALSEGAWHRVAIKERQEVTYRTAKTFIASRDDLLAVFRLCGRPKDLERMALLAS